MWNSILFFFSLSLLAQNTPPAATPAAPGGGRGGAAAPAAAGAGGQVNPNDTVLKALDCDIADVDKVAYTSLPAVHIPNKMAPGAGNPLIIRAYTFIPKKMDRSKK